LILKFEEIIGKRYFEKVKKGFEKEDEVKEPKQLSQKLIL